MMNLITQECCTWRLLASLYGDHLQENAVGAMEVDAEPVRLDLTAWWESRPGNDLMSSCVSD